METVTTLSLVAGNNTGFQSINVTTAMMGLALHTQRAYQRSIREYLAEVNLIDKELIDLTCLDVAMAQASLGPAYLKVWLGKRKAAGRGKSTIEGAKSAVVWLAQLLADAGCADYALPGGLSRVKPPRAEVGQRKGTWLTLDEVRQLLRVVNSVSAMRRNVRDVAMVTLMVTCGLRSGEIAAATWGDLSREGYNAVLKVHGKGSKLRIVKLPALTTDTIEAWRVRCPATGQCNPMFPTLRKRGGEVVDAPLTTHALAGTIRRFARKAGMPNIAPHDLRRTFARGAYESGASLELIRQTLGHANVATTEKYINCRLELDRAATDIWVDGICGVKHGTNRSA